MILRANHHVRQNILPELFPSASKSRSFPSGRDSFSFDGKFLVVVSDTLW